ncbi:DEAD/DEAH box helicase family protein [Amycolatopsis speibonae]|uniref:DEAD/DEAH box helicase family protein n=1 Tax=Amycolatopsis speibonae TaxID=1450224 RepID=A0ABV7P2Z2_9PSEU
MVFEASGRSTSPTATTHSLGPGDCSTSPSRRRRPASCATPSGGFDRSLVQMATGAGKTITAVAEYYRLMKLGGFNRLLFPVDRNNLGDQTPAEFESYRTPDDGRRFTGPGLGERRGQGGPAGGKALPNGRARRLRLGSVAHVQPDTGRHVAALSPGSNWR